MDNFWVYLRWDGWPHVLVTFSDNRVELWSDPDEFGIAKSGAHGSHNIVDFFTPWKCRAMSTPSDYFTIFFEPMHWISNHAGQRLFLGYKNGQPHGWLMFCRTGVWSGNHFPTDGDGNRLATDEGSEEDDSLQEPSDEEEVWLPTDDQEPREAPSPEDEQEPWALIREILRDSEMSLNPRQ